MTIHNLSALKRKLHAFSPVPREEFEVLAGKLGKPKVVDAREELRFEQQWPHKAFLIAEGWACSYRQLPTGGRQIIDIAIAGDMIGMRSLLMHNAYCHGAAITPAIVFEISSATVFELLDSAPRMAAAILWSISRDEAILTEHLANLGRRTARERVAHFFLELKHRLDLIGKVNGTSYSCPLSHSHLADTLGLTSVHLNRVMRELREEDIINFKDGTVDFIDEEKAVALAGFDERYLDHKQAKQLEKQTGMRG